SWFLVSRRPIVVILLLFVFTVCSCVTCMTLSLACSLFFFFNDTATTEIYTLSLHDALPISKWILRRLARLARPIEQACGDERARDRKSTRLNSSHEWISYAVFCLKKKKKTRQQTKHINNKPIISME